MHTSISSSLMMKGKRNNLVFTVLSHFKLFQESEKKVMERKIYCSDFFDLTQFSNNKLINGEKNELKFVL